MPRKRVPIRKKMEAARRMKRRLKCLWCQDQCWILVRECTYVACKNYDVVKAVREEWK